MADSRFFKRKGPFSVQDIADLTGAGLVNAPDPKRVFDDVAPLQNADASILSFFDNRKYLDAFAQSAAGGCFVRPEFADRAPDSMVLFTTSDPYRAYAKAATAFYPFDEANGVISDNAVVDASAKLGKGVQVDAGAVIGANCDIGDGTIIASNAVIGEGVVIGAGCKIGAGSTITHSLIGNLCLIYPGARIGQDGFGFAMGPQGHLKVPQLGRVVIGNDVEVGANSTIDRGAGPDTVIGNGCRIDNLVQIGHNVELGMGCVVVAQVGISGSTKLGNFVVAAGQAGITGHLEIGDGAKIAAQSGVMRNIGPGETVGGSPAVPVMEYHKQTVALSRLIRKKK
ncbi:UDP-3-O-(3-hydroxymyristoyl)glucosamine N-acyltransferase [Thalassospira alkalitolerans]|uniref:UDP-3-O-acylglucosamine N-acyltransferase n=1 Tax=Thalassospira alkalitolerans TaxID=1293890 RepID=A0A1Y2LCX4_9PROT|nr:UDP-3-O-(3-hydroxymyristoyl)glucosamine N-acyltransferase [Thalassospira alkalitolerans]OSQ48764.1 UDP-3-O-(3-hydroxymyristoyl) glucosamine N-acyltransferase [Thalassospira alkalitolerans]